MSDLKQAQAMLRMAHRDLKALGGMHDDAVFADEIFGFHVQQAVEKSLKAWMCAIGMTYPFTHHLNRLLMLLKEAGMNVDAFWWADEFTIYAHQARYEEGHLSADAPLDRDQILAAVASLVQKINTQIKNIQTHALPKPPPSGSN
ncbi:MAG: HEPN domain-containing protein [Rhodoferax sp.]|nr:HEPN domain-containing protein [Rhodoferax sp.]